MVKRCHVHVQRGKVVPAERITILPRLEIVVAGDHQEECGMRCRFLEPEFKDRCFVWSTGLQKRDGRPLRCRQCREAGR